jgi:hypothetical protein
MTIDRNVQTIINAAADLHLPTPETVTEARAFQAAASELLDSVKAEQAPDLNTATLKTLAKAHAEAVEFDTAHDAKVKHGELLVKIGETRLSTAWGPAVCNMEPELAAEFDRLAVEFAAELEKLGNVDAEAVAADHYNPAYTTVRALADRLSVLKDVRHAYADMGGRSRTLCSDVFEMMSRVLILQSHNLAMNPPRGMRRSERIGLPYWAAAARHPDIQIRWQTPQQQDAQPAMAPFVRQRAQRAAMQAERVSA